MPSTSGHSLDDLLAREDIDAVIIALPICVQPIVIKESIEAGKHVLSEKPIAKDIETAAHLIRWYKHQKREKIWSVGENFRFFEPIVFAGEHIKMLGGELATFSVDMYAFIDEKDVYYQTTWYASNFFKSLCFYIKLMLTLWLGGRNQTIKVASFSMVVSILSLPFDPS